MKSPLKPPPKAWHEKHKTQLTRQPASKERNGRSEAHRQLRSPGDTKASSPTHSVLSSIGRFRQPPPGQPHGIQKIIFECGRDRGGQSQRTPHDHHADITNRVSLPIGRTRRVSDESVPPGSDTGALDRTLTAPFFPALGRMSNRHQSRWPPTQLTSQVLRGPTPTGNNGADLA